MAITLRQAASNANSSQDGRTCTVTFDQPTNPGSLILIFSAVASSYVTATVNDSNFVLTRERIQGGITLTHWHSPGAASLNSVQVRITRTRPFEVFALEYEGIRQSSPLDRHTAYGRSDNECDSGTTQTTTQSDALVVAGVANLFESCRQSGFTGGMTRLFEQVTPTIDQDSDRVRLTVHHYIASATSQFRLRGSLSSHRDWASILATYKGSSTGPARMTATNTDSDHKTVRLGGTAVLTAFGPLKATSTAHATVTVTGSADMWPFDYQYALNGHRALIGTGTDYRVLSVEGLNGWQLRTSDSDQPFSDGATRGVDLMSARQVLFEIATLPGGGTTEEIEASLRGLYDALIPQRDTDWELIWRHPGQGVRMLRCRPIDLVRGMDAKRVLLQDQKFALRAADPRHYAPLLARVQLAVSTATATIVNEVATDGTAPAYPIIRATANQTISRLELYNDSADVGFDLKTNMGSGAELVADVDARVRATGASPVTINGVSKYGAWQSPRANFYLAPSPQVADGVNRLRVHTTPAGANVTVTLEYRDTFYG